jgi:sugar phosphate isomerase/epimerase
VSFRLALSNSVLVDLAWAEQARRAREWGFEGLVLSGPHGGSDLLLQSEREAAAVGETLREAGMVVAAVEAGVGLCSSSEAAREGAREQLRRLLVTTAQVGSRHLLVRGGGLYGLPTKAHALAQTAATLADVGPYAAQQRVELVFENGGLLNSSQDAWFVTDAAGPRPVRTSLNVRAALDAGEPPSIAIPRLGRSLALVRLTEFAYGTDGKPQPAGVHAPALVDIPLLIDLLKGIAFEGWLCVSWPPGTEEQQPALEAALPAIAAMLLAERDRKTVELSAYKGDRNAPRFAATRPHAQPGR